MTATESDGGRIPSIVGSNGPELFAPQSLIRAVPPWRQSLRSRLASFLREIARVLRLRPRQWPEGEPLMIGGDRVGTRLADGTIVGAPGVAFDPLPICSRCQEAIEAEAHERDADRVEQ